MSQFRGRYWPNLPQHFKKSWVTLADGTPLITAGTEGRGRIVFIHTAPSPGWSDLPLSGFFVEMLQCIITIASQPVTDTALESGHVLAPWRIIAARGGLEPAHGYVKPLFIHDGQLPAPAFSPRPALWHTRDAACT